MRTRTRTKGNRYFNFKWQYGIENTSVSHFKPPFSLSKRLGGKLQGKYIKSGSNRIKMRFSIKMGIDEEKYFNYE